MVLFGKGLHFCIASRFTIYSINQIYKISDILYQIYYINKIDYMSIKIYATSDI